MDDGFRCIRTVLISYRQRQYWYPGLGWVSFELYVHSYHGMYVCKYVLQYYKYYVFVKITLLSGYQVRYGLQKKKYMCVTVYLYTEQNRLLNFALVWQSEHSLLGSHYDVPPRNVPGPGTGSCVLGISLVFLVLYEVLLKCIPGAHVQYHRFVAPVRFLDRSQYKHTQRTFREYHW